MAATPFTIAQINFQVLFDQLEWQFVHGRPGSRWDSRSWIGGDRNRLWIRTEGEAVDGVLDTAEAQLLFGRSFSRWWEVVAGVRFDARPTPVAHLAGGRRPGPGAAVPRRASDRVCRPVRPHRGAGSKSSMTCSSRSDSCCSRSSSSASPARTIRTAASAPGSAPARSGFRVRYEFRREIAPYAGVVWHRKLFGTGDSARERGGDAGGWHVVAGLRWWL